MSEGTQPGARASDEYTPRARLAALIARAEIDPDGFGAELKADPEGKLQEIGFSAAEVRGLRAQEREDEPGAALRAGCNDTSCGLSLCPPTCFVTVPALPGLCRTDCKFFSL